MHSNILLIDGQVFQTEARDRGMGRYSASLVKSLLAQNHYKTVKLVINMNLRADLMEDKGLRKMLRGIDIVKLSLKDTTKTKIEAATVHNKLEINHYINSISSENCDIDYLILSPFQEPVVSVFPDGVRKTLIFYDLIPYLYHLRYQASMQFDNYLKRFSLLFEADRLLTISQSVRDDLMMYLGIQKNRIVSIDGAAIKSDNKSQKPKGVVLPANYILMPTSDDPRKNNLRAVMGFEEFRSSQSDNYKLVITSNIHKSERDRLNAQSKNLLFTGKVKDAELDWLYTKCQAVLFVPESEGLGLPILEAVLNNKRVICSSISVFKEISIDAFYYCDHENHHSIANSIIQALGADDRSVPKTKYKSILRHYNWVQTAKRSIQAIKSIKIGGLRNRSRKN